MASRSKPLVKLTRFDTGHDEVFVSPNLAFRLPPVIETKVGGVRRGGAGKFIRTLRDSALDVKQQVVGEYLGFWSAHGNSA
jgi:hypothetical protein